MRSDLLLKYISRPRYNRYLLATGNNKEKAQRLYHANLRLAQAFYPLSSQFEVVFRNSLNNVLITKLGDQDWIITEKNGFMSDPSLKQGHFYLKRSVQKSEDELANSGIPKSSGKIISNQMFGFWTSFFSVPHFRLVGGAPIHVFPHKPRTENRASIFDKLNTIRDFRNRVFHCEPICFHGHIIDCSLPMGIRKTLFELVEWIEPDLVPFFDDLDSIQSKVDSIMRI